jgi:hypothetical protein
METPLLYRQLQDPLRQWVRPKDQRHLQGFSEIVAAILQSKECLLREVGHLPETPRLPSSCSHGAVKLLRP